MYNYVYIEDLETTIYLQKGIEHEMNEVTENVIFNSFKNIIVTAYDDVGVDEEYASLRVTDAGDYTPEPSLGTIFGLMEEITSLDSDTRYTYTNL